MPVNIGEKRAYKSRRKTEKFYKIVFFEINILVLHVRLEEEHCYCAAPSVASYPRASTSRELLH